MNLEMFPLLFSGGLYRIGVNSLFCRIFLRNHLGLEIGGGGGKMSTVSLIVIGLFKLSISYWVTCIFLGIVSSKLSN